MNTEFDPQGRVYWGPHALSFPSAIWFDTSQDPLVSLKLNIGGEGSTAQYLTIATFNKTNSKNSLSMAGNSAAQFHAVDGISLDKTGDIINLTFDVPTLTNVQIDELRQFLLPADAQGMLASDGSGTWSWVSSGFTSNQGTIANTGTGQDLDLDLVASATSNAIAQFMLANPNDPAAQALGEAVSALSDGDNLHNVLLAHYSADTTDLAALQALLSSGTDTDTRVVLSFVDTNNDGKDDCLRMAVYAVDVATNNITGSPLSFTDLPLSRFFNGGMEHGAWQTPTLLNGWNHFAAPHGPASFLKDALGFVHLRGLVIDGVSDAATPVFQLPVGYRPGMRYHFLAWINKNGVEEGVRIFIDPNGDVCVPTLQASIPFYMSLCGISFLAEG